MKRELCLVAYSSSEESEPEEADVTLAFYVYVYAAQPSSRKLPTLSASLTGPQHVDNPSLHEGRTRSKPHVDGQYAAHIYASVPLSRSSGLFKLLCKIIESGQTMVPSLHDFWSNDSKPELHISLSRPIYLRAHQREEIKRAVKNVADKSPPFTASFAHVSELINDERTRIFLALEVGAGHHEFATLTSSLTPTLRAIRQQEFYSSPRFHASIGWALLGGKDSVEPPNSSDSTNFTTNMDQPSLSSIRADSSNLSTPTENEYFKVTEFPPTLVSSLNEQYGAALVGSVAKSFDVTELCIKIGKDITRWRLNGA
ncbi:U6 snRNA phosphodiesterase [Favolaschia claudopus]|uniref:U6 snRNA phosphodiesterase 1 n=1 Tax=Favolaschia claudopus TaxID=2862362 RepID=A0AAW0DB38_9AGAR